MSETEGWTSISTCRFRIRVCVSSSLTGRGAILGVRTVGSELARRLSVPFCSRIALPVVAFSV